MGHNNTLLLGLALSHAPWWPGLESLLSRLYLITLMNKADLAQTTPKKGSEFEALFEAGPPNYTTEAGTRPTSPGRTHQCVSVIWELLVCRSDDCLGSSKVLLCPSTHHHPKGSIEDADYIPEMTAGRFSLLSSGWMNSLMTLGYACPQEEG